MHPRTKSLCFFSSNCIVPTRPANAPPRSISATSSVGLFIMFAIRGFGGITGDVIGASNEIGRLSFVIVYVVLS